MLKYLILLAFLVSCCSGEDPVGRKELVQPLPDSGVDASLDAAPDTGPLPRGDYPEGPYGLSPGDIMDDYWFISPDGMLTLNELRQDPRHTLLLLFGGGGACIWCEVEAPQLELLFEIYEDEGLLILGVLMTDDSWATPDLGDAHHYFTVSHSANYPWGAAPWILGQLFADLTEHRNLSLPVNYMLDLETMEVLDVVFGYPSGGVLTMLEDRGLL